MVGMSNHGWQSQSTDGPPGGWNVELSICLSVYPSIHLSFLLSTDLSVCQPIHLPVFPSICLALYPSMQPSIHHPISVYVSICLSFSLLLSFEICPIPCLSVSCCLCIYLAVYIIWPSSYPFYPFKYRSISPIYLSSSSSFHLVNSTLAQTRHRANKPLVSVVV